MSVTFYIRRSCSWLHAIIYFCFVYMKILVSLKLPHRLGLCCAVLLRRPEALAERPRKSVRVGGAWNATVHHCSINLGLVQASSGAAWFSLLQRSKRWEEEGSFNATQFPSALVEPRDGKCSALGALQILNDDPQASGSKYPVYADRTRTDNNGKWSA